MGFLMQTTMLIAQNSVEQKDLGVASSAATFFRSIGGSFGVSMFGAIFTGRLTAELTDRFGAVAADRMSSSGGQITSAALAGLPAPVRNGLLESLAASIGSVFFWAIFFAVVVPILAAFLKEIPLRSGPMAPAAESEVDERDERDELDAVGGR